MFRTLPRLAGATLAWSLAACPAPLSGEDSALRLPGQAGEGTPAGELQALVVAAEAGDVASFRARLSRDFIATVERYQELAGAKEELRGAFDWPVFMRSLARSRPQPREEWVRGDKATVSAVHGDGREVKTEMVREEGRWKLAVPPGMVSDLDHFEDVEKKLRPPADAGPAGGGAAALPSGQRLSLLPPDASDAERQRARALDAFEKGDFTGAEQALQAAAALLPEDEELQVALGRTFVQLGKAEQARAQLERFVARAPASLPARHYLGMAYMMVGNPAAAAASWREVLRRDAAYGARFRLDQRVQAAEAMARGASVGAHPVPASPGP